MKTSIQKTFKFFKAATILAILIAVLPLGISNASTFQSSLGTTQSPLDWNSSATWTVTTRTIGSTNTIPGEGDEVLIFDQGKIIANADIQCKRLTIQAAPAGNKQTSFYLNGYNLIVGMLEINGGSNDNGAQHKKAEFLLQGGIVTVLGPESTNFIKTYPNNINIDYGSKNGVPGQIIFTPGPLPVELISFTATKKNAEVVLTWATASEKNNTGFEVQSSLDGKSYQAIDFVASQNGNASSVQHYAFTDKAANKEGLVYYRLKQIDLDGTFEYYTAKVVNLGRFNFTAATYPNPFQNIFKIAVGITTPEATEVLVTDMTGKTVYKAQPALIKGANILEVDLKAQPAGLYLLKVTTGTNTYTNRLVKQ